MAERRYFERVPIFLIMIAALIMAAVVGVFLQQQRVMTIPGNSQTQAKLLDEQRADKGEPACRDRARETGQGTGEDEDDGCRPPMGSYPCVDRHRNEKGKGHHRDKHCSGR